MPVPLLSSVEQPKRLIADKAYDVDSLREWLKARRIRAVIPSTAARTVPYPLDRAAYRRRNLIERLFGRLKNWRRIATRYDRLARNYLAALVSGSPGPRRCRSRVGQMSPLPSGQSCFQAFGEQLELADSIFQLVQRYCFRSVLDGPLAVIQLEPKDGLKRRRNLGFRHQRSSRQGSSHERLKAMCPRRLSYEDRLKRT